MRIAPYKSIFRIKLISGLQYRTVALASICINLFWGLILTTLMLLFYRLGRPHDLNMTLKQSISYIWIVQCFISLIPLQLDSEVYQRITSGDFAYELCRPLDMYNHWFARSMASRVANTLLKSGIALIICFLIPEPYRLQPPSSLTALLGSILLLFGALLLSCSFSNFMNTILLNVELGPGLNNLLSAIITVFSGSLVPLSIFPDWIKPVLTALPFSGLIDYPCEIYTGIMPAAGVPQLFLRQLLWIVILTAVGRWNLARFLKKTVIQGG
ncbi:ABC-2 family transporter protein [Clostridium sp. 19966]|uniref:ABC transporter permease n=1 Tax=Clostridium sp. 19966 TaxID=2768166 RepID=UPI0028DDEA39|nr:ABC-2 family transporter protein [Clostridium sp. 19966]MDT8719289.1 ABC-2 family transporter protein [Clostridium sp. 19966]